MAVLTRKDLASDTWARLAAHLRTELEASRTQLESKLPKRHWVEINKLMVPFGKHVCTGKLPKCSQCPVLEYCRQLGVEKHR